MRYAINKYAGGNIDYNCINKILAFNYNCYTAKLLFKQSEVYYFIQPHKAVYQSLIITTKFDLLFRLALVTNTDIGISTTVFYNS